MVTKFSGMPEHGTSRTPVQMEGGRSGSRNGKYRMVASNCHRYDWISLAWISAERDPDRHAPHLLHLQVEVAGLLAILGRDLDGPVTVRCMGTNTFEIAKSDIVEAIHRNNSSSSPSANLRAATRGRTAALAETEDFMASDILACLRGLMRGSNESTQRSAEVHIVLYCPS